MKRSLYGFGAKFIAAAVALLLAGSAARAAEAAITWGTGTALDPIDYGVRLSTTPGTPGYRLNATANGNGTIAYRVVVVINGSATQIDANNVLLNAGENYQVSAIYTPGSNDSVTAAQKTMTLQVKKVPLSVVIKTKTRRYGETQTLNTANDLTWSGFVNNENQNTPGVVSTPAAIAEKAGITATTPVQTVTGGVVFTTKPIADNYVVSTADGTLIISPASLVLKADPASKTYGGGNPTFTGKYSLNGGADTAIASGANLVMIGTDTIKVDWKSGINSADPTKDGAQASSVTAQVNDSTPPVLSNYQVSVQPATFTINKAVLTATSTAASSKVYGEANPAFNLVFTGFVNGETETTAGVFSVKPALGAVDPQSGAGTVTIPITDGSAPNYTINKVQGSLTITKRDINITFDDKFRVFGTPNPALTYTIQANRPAATGVTPAGKATFDTDAKVLDSASNALEAETTAVIGSAVGEYPISRKGTTGTVSANYNATFVAGKLTVTKLLPTFTWNIATADATFVYGTTLGTRLNATATPFTTTGTTASTITYQVTLPGASTASTITSASILPVGTHTITAIYTPGTTDSATHATGLFNQTVTVTPKAITLKTANQTRAYKAENSTLNLTKANAFQATTDLVGTDTIASIWTTDPTFTINADANSNAGGDYTIVMASGVAPNYTITPSNVGKLTITKLNTAAPTWTIAADKNKIKYGQKLGADQLTAVSPSANPLGTVSYRVAGSSTFLTADSLLDANAGVSVEAVFVPADQVNYNTSPSVARTIVVEQLAVTITPPTGKTKVYGQATPEKFTKADGVNVGDLIGADSIDVQYIVTADGRNVNSPVGTYALTAQISDPKNRLSNYSLSLSPGTYTITQKTVTVTLKADRKMTFNGTYTTLTPANDLDYVGFIDGENRANVLDGKNGNADGNGATIKETVIRVLKADNTAFTPDATTAFGTYKVDLSATASRNYKYEHGTSGTFSVTKITPSLNITATDLNNLNLYYGQDIKTAKLGATVLLDTIELRNAANALMESRSGVTAPAGAHKTVSFNSGKATAYITFGAGWNTDNGIFNAGSDREVRIQFYPSDANYSDFDTTLKFNVDKRDVEVTVVNNSRYYGDINPINSVTYRSTEFDGTTRLATWVGKDKDTSVDSDGNGDASNEDEPSAGVLSVQPVAAAQTATLYSAPGGAYPITFVQKPEASNYRFSEVTANLTINKRPITVTTVPVERFYLEANPTVVIDYSSKDLNGQGFAPGENENNTGSNQTGNNAFIKAQFNAANLPPASAAANSYPIIVSGAFGANYIVTHKPGTIIVKPAVPTLVWNSPASITYGSPIGGAQKSAVATFNGVAVAGTFAYAEDGQILNAGTRTLKATFTSTNPNVATGKEVTTTIVVNKAPLTVSAAPVSLVYGATNPGFSLVYGTYAGPDTAVGSAPTISTTRVANSPVGTYDLVVTGGDDDNYTIVPQSTGKITVTPKALTVAANAATRVYGDANPTFDTTVTGLIEGDTISSLGTIVVSTTATATSAAGEYVISVSGGSSANYTTTLTPGTLTVTKAPLTVKAENQTRAYNTDNPAAQLTYTGFKNSETASVLKTAATTTYAAVKTSDVGTYAITVSGATADNYTITFVNGELTVTQAAPVVTWAAPAAISYGTALSSVQLSASADVPGTFAYTPASGIVLKAGADQALSATFTPTDAKNYSSVTTANKISVNKATPVVTWVAPAAITYGTAIGSSQLSASFSTAGTAAYTPAAGSVLNAGSQALSVTFTPTDAENYNSATASVNVTVNKAALTVAADAKTKQFNADLPELTTTVTGLVNGDSASVVGTLSLSTTATASSPIGTYPIRLAGGLTSANYDIVTVGSTLTVTKASPAVVWAAPADITVGTALGDSQLNATSTVAGVFAYVPTKGTVLPLGNGQKLEAIFIPSDAANYELVRSVNTINVTTPAAKPVNPADFNADGNSDLLFQHTDGFLAAWFMDGATLKQGVLLSPETAGDARWEVVGYGDFNGDSNGDILFQYNGGNFDGALAIWYLNGTQLLEAKLVTPESNPGAGWDAVAVADINGDKKADIVFQHTEGFLAAWFQDGANSIGKTLLNPVAPFGLDGTVDAGWRVVAATDLNGDKKTDLVFQYSGGAFDRTVAVWYMNGINQTGADLLSPSNPGAGWSVVAAADYNGDSKNDLVLQHTSGLLGIWYLNGVTQSSATLVTPETPGAGWRAVAP